MRETTHHTRGKMPHLTFAKFTTELKKQATGAARIYTNGRSYPVHITILRDGKGTLDFCTFQAMTEGHSGLSLSKIDTPDEMKNWANYLKAEGKSGASDLWERYLELCEENNV